MQRFDEMRELLEAFCPMHVIFDHSGQILHAGATISKLAAGDDLIGQPFLEVFEPLRPRALETVLQLRRCAGQRLRFRTRGAPRTSLKGELVDFEDANLCVVNLSFGISVMEAVRDYALTSADFAATDLTIEMLYLMEAKSAAMEASRKLNQRLQGAKIAAEEQAFTDTLTGLKNRRALDTILQRWLDEGRPLVVAQMDLDFFKSVNDTLGHAAGDLVLQTVARILVEETRDDDCVVRVGGDEFVLVLPGTMSDQKISNFAKRLIARVEKPVLFKGEPCRVSTSLGFSISTVAQPLNSETLLERADTALYAAKRSGRAQHRIYSESIEILPSPPEPWSSVASPVGK